VTNQPLLVLLLLILMLSVKAIVTVLVTMVLATGHYALVIAALTELWLRREQSAVTLKKELAILLEFVLLKKSLLLNIYQNKRKD